MTVLALVLLSVAFLVVGGSLYSRYLSRTVGEEATRPTPAVVRNDGRDYVPSPTPVVFAHHFASIAGAGPIIGPVIAVVYGWVPALLWVTLGGVFIGCVHDYLALHMATREGGQSIATIAQRLLGKGIFLALMLFLVLMLVLVCAAFLNLSAVALMSMLPFDRVGLSADQTLFHVIDKKVVIGGIASMSVIVITACGPLLGWLYLKKKVSVWWCSALALVICGASIVFGLYCPVALPEVVNLAGLSISGTDLWKLMLGAYVLVAAGLPVWIFLQSRDFINVHLLYAGLAVLVVTLLVGVFVLASSRLQLAFRWRNIVGLSVVASFSKAFTGGGYGPLVCGGQVLAGLDTRAAVASTTLAEAVVCLATAGAYVAAGQGVALELLIPLAAGSLLSTPLSAVALKRLPPRLTRRLMGVGILLLTGAALLRIGGAL